MLFDSLKFNKSRLLLVLINLMMSLFLFGCLNNIKVGLRNIVPTASHDVLDKLVTTFAGSAGTLTSRDDTIAAKARFYHSFGVAIDSAGNAFIADTFNHSIRKITPAGVVTTFAGKSGVPGSADGTGASARFYNPYGIAIDSVDNIFVSDASNQAIRKITPAGVVSTFAGTLGASGSTDGNGAIARFFSPSGIAIDSANNLFVVDTTNHTIRKITPTADVTTFAGTALLSGSNEGTGAAARFNNPFGITIDSADNLYVSDSNNHKIRKITPVAVVTTFAGFGLFGSADGAGAAARFAFPRGLTADSFDNIFVADSANQTIRKITPAGLVTTFAGTTGLSGSDDGLGTIASFNYPFGIASDGSDNLYVSDSSNNTIRKISSAGNVTTYAGTAGALSSADGLGVQAEFNYPAGAAVDSNNNLYVSDNGNNTIRKITPNGVVTTFAGTAGTWGTTDGTGAAARFQAPAGIAIDSADNVYVADAGNDAIRKITPAGVVTTLAGLPGTSGNADGAGGAARFNYPNGLAVDSHDNVFVADTQNHSIRKITPAGVVTTFAGTSGTWGHTDAVGAAAEFYGPFGIAVDKSDNLFVADSSNSTIRKITPAASVTTIAGVAEVYGNTDGVSATALFDFPYGLSLDSDGNIYVADLNNSVIRKISTVGEVTTFSGTAAIAGSTDGSLSSALFNSPRDVTVDHLGNIYVIDSSNNTVRLIK